LFYFYFSFTTLARTEYYIANNPLFSSLALLRYPRFDDLPRASSLRALKQIHLLSIVFILLLVILFRNIFVTFNQ